MKKVLIISYYFPPSGGPGVQRVLKFVRYLPEFGWEPLVLTVNDGDFPARDESLLNEIPPSVKVCRTGIFEPYGLYRKLTGRSKGAALDVDNIAKGRKQKLSERLAELIRSTFFIPDARRGWLGYALREGKRIIREERPDLIFSSSPPYTCALIGMKLKKYAGSTGVKIPWVFDLRDAWTGFLWAPDRWFIPAAIDKSYERNTLSSADAVTIVAKGIKEDLDAKYPEISKKKEFQLIRNGFDPEDFQPEGSGKMANTKFTIVYTGSMYGKRNPYFLLDTVSEMAGEGVIDKEKIKFLFVGRCGQEITKYLNGSPLKDTVELIPYVTHAESIRYLMKADAMLLLIDEDKYSKMILSGKVFEYLGASLKTGKPIMAIAPEGEASELIAETNSGTVIGHNDRLKLREAFLKYYNSFFENKSTFSVNSEAIKQYDRKLLTKRLAEVFDKTIS